MSENLATGNIWKQLRGLVRDDVLYVGTSQGPNGDGTIDVLLVGSGETIRATGNNSNGVAVFVKNGVVTGTAPAPSATVLDV